MSEQQRPDPAIPPEELNRLSYDFQVGEGEIILSPDEAWEIRRFIRGVEEGSPYRSLYLEVDEQYLRGWPTEAPIRLGDNRVIALAGTYVGMLWDTDKADTTKVQKLRYKIDRLLELLPEAQQKPLDNS